MATRRLALIGTSAVLAGCLNAPLSSLCGGPPCPSERTVEQVFQSDENRMLDILFVVDDTAAIAPYQASLPDGFAFNAGVLEGMYGGVPNLHVGFVSSSLCAGAPVSRAQACGLQAPGAFATVNSCGQHTNLPGSLGSALACLGTFGVTDCEPAQPLAVLRRVLGDPPPGWEGFFRPDATLAIVVVAAEDDASPGAVSDTTAFLRSLKAEPDNQILLAAITGGDCALADPTPSFPPRVREFVASAGANGLIALLCADGVRFALESLATTLATLRAPDCVPGIRDVDPTTPGVQAACDVEQTITRHDGSSTTTVLPSCDLAAPPCWRVGTPSTALASYCNGSTFQVTQAADFCREFLTRTRVECLGCLDPADPACAGH